MDQLVVNLKMAGFITAGIAFFFYAVYTLVRAVKLQAPASSLVTAGAPAAVTSSGSGRRQAMIATRLGQFGTVFTLTSVLFLGTSVIMRWIIAGRAPFSNQYEFSVTFAFAILLTYFFIERRYGARTIGVFVYPVALGLLAYSTSVPATIDPLIPALQSNLILTVHVGMAVLAYALAAIAFATSVMYLIQGDGHRISWLPSGLVLEQITYRSLTIAFPAFAIMLVLGAIWGNQAWGRFWGWDPKETAALATFIIYALYLHTRAIVGWRGRKTAILPIIGFAMVLFTFYGVNLFLGGLHSYAGLQ